MRKPTVENKYNLKLADIKNLEVLDRSQIKGPLFWRNDVVHAWCVSENTAKTPKDHEYGAYNDYWIGIYDEDAPAYKGKIRVALTSFGGMATYKFKEFFNPKEIENELDLEIQEKLLNKINYLIDNGILG